MKFAPSLRSLSFCFERCLFIVILLFAVNGLNCGHREIRTDVRKQIHEIISKGSKVYSQVTRVVVNIHKRGLYTLFMELDMRNPDTSEAQSIYVPLFRTDMPVEFGKDASLKISRYYPCGIDFETLCDDGDDDSTDRNMIDAGVITIKTKDHNYYYVAGFSKEELRDVLDDTLYQPGNLFKIQFACTLIDQNKLNYINFIAGNRKQKTDLIVHVDSGYKMKDLDVFLEKSTAGKLSPETTDSTGVKRYGFSRSYDADSLIGVSLATRQVLAPLQKFFIFLKILLASLVCLVLAEYFYQYLFKRRLLREKRWSFGRLTAIIRHGYEGKEKEVSKTSSNKISNEKIGFDDELYLYQLETQEKKLLTNDFKQREQNFLRSRLRLWLLPLIAVLLLTIFFLLFAISARGQNNNVINNLEMNFNLSYDDRDDFKLSLDLSYQICALRRRNRSKAMYVKFEGQANRIEFSKIAYDPDSIDCGVKPPSNSKEVCLKTSPAVFARQHELDMLLNNELNGDEVSLKALDPEKNKCNVSIPFLHYETKRVDYYKPLLGFRFHRFPYDRDTIRIPLSFEQFVLLKAVNIPRVDKFTGQPTINIPALEYTEDGKKYSYSGKKPSHLQPGESIIVEVVLRRSKTARVIFPILIVVSIVCSVFAAILRKSRLLKVLGTVFAHATIVGVYFLLVKDVYQGIPYFLQSQDVINCYDLLFALSFVVSVTLSFIRKKGQR